MKILLTFLFILYSINTFSQIIKRDLISVSGGEFKANAINLSWSIGEVAIESYSNREVLDQGFIQNFDIILNTISDNRHTNLKVFPNPFSDFIRIADVFDGKYKVTIFESSGKMVLNENLNPSGIIDTQELKNGVYFIRIESDNGQNLAETLKIIKQN